MGTAHDMDKATRTYGSFVGSLKWIVPLLAVITLVIIVLISG